MRVLVAVLSLLAASCATTAAPVSLTALLRVQIHERAGLYPKSLAIPGESHAPQLEKLTAWAEGRGIVVTTAHIIESRGLRGSVQAGYGGWVILLDHSLTANAKLYTLLHELAHIYGPRVTTEEDAEVVAELIAAMTCARLGLDVWPQSTAYLAMRVPSLDDQIAVVQRVGGRIDRVVEALVRYLEKPKTP